MELCVDLAQFLGHYNVSYILSINDVDLCTYK